MVESIGMENALVLMPGLGDRLPLVRVTHMRAVLVQRFLLVSPLLVAGCRFTEPLPLDAASPEPQASRAAGLRGELEFHFEGEPDDVAGSESGALHFSEAIEAAVRNDPRLQQTLARWRRARAESEAARILPNPVLALGLGLSGLSTPKVSVNLVQELAAYLQRPHRANAADDRLRSATEDVLTAALDVVADVSELYAKLQAIEAQIPVLAERQSILMRLRDFEHLKLEHGEGVQADVTSLDAERANVSVDLAELEAERREGRLVLARMVGKPSAASAWTLDSWSAPSVPLEAERDWIQAALAQRPEIHALDWELAALGEEQKLVATWPWEGSSAGVGAEYDDGFFIGPTAEIPLRLHDPSQPRDAAAVAVQTEVRHRITETRRRVIEEVRTAWAALTSARAALDLLSTEVLPLLERRRAEVEAAYQAGEGDLAALLLADQALQEARARHIELEERAVLARIHLERAGAGPSTDSPSPLPAARERHE